MLLKDNHKSINHRFFKQIFITVLMLSLIAVLAGCQVALPAPVVVEPVAESDDGPAVAEPVAASDDEVMEDAMMPVVSTANVHLFPADGENDIAGATSTLERRADGVTLTIDTVDLVPNEVYTVWWVVFNNPAACASTPCVGPDLSNPETMSMVGYATGEIADENGRATFKADLAVGETTGALDNTSGFPFELPEPAPGLIDPMTAEIHGVIRTHGAALKDPSGQLSSFNDGCNPECMNVQAALHKAEVLSSK